MPHGLVGDQGDVGTWTPSPISLAIESRSVAYASAMRAWMLDSGLGWPLTWGAVLGMTNADSVSQSLMTLKLPASLFASLALVVYSMLMSPLCSAEVRVPSSVITLNSIESR